MMGDEKIKHVLFYSSRVLMVLYNCYGGIICVGISRTRRGVLATTQNSGVLWLSVLVGRII